MRAKGLSRPSSGRAALVCGVAFILFTIPTLAQLPPQMLHGHVPSAVSNGQAHFVAPLPATQQFNLSIVLPMRNEAQLKGLLNQLYDSSSPIYHKFLSVPQFTERFGPTVEDYQAVVDFAKANGFTVTGTPADRMSVPVKGTASQIENAFHVKMNVYRHPTENRLFFSPDREPSLDLSVPVGFVSGLNNFSPPRPMASKGNGHVNSNGAGPGGSYLPGDMRAAYYGSGPLTGSGQCVSLVEFGGYSIQDVADTFDGAATWSAISNHYTLTYNTGGGQYTIPIINVPVNGAYIGAYNSDEVEVVLDIAQAIGMAPGLSSVRVYFAPDAWSSANPDYEFPSSYNGIADDYAILEQMVTDFGNEVGCNQASISWNWAPENPLNDADNGKFDQFAAIGISFFAASGDYGSWNLNFTCNYTSPYQCFFYPEEYPHLTAVGGTILTTTGPGGSWVSESGWNNSPYASGGGISPDHFAIPPYQQAALYGNNETSTIYRNAPDVAMEANQDNYVCTLGSCSGDWAGTSFAAPRWAAFTALANQSLGSLYGGLGLINNTIYSIGVNPNIYLTDFNEIAGGSNGAYSVVAGQYNMVTGWGSPKGQNLINALAPQMAATPTNSSSYTTYGFPPLIDFTETLYDDTPGAQIYWQVDSCSGNTSGSDPLSSGGSFDLEYQSGFNCNPNGTAWAQAPGYSPSQTVPIYF